MYQLSPSLLPGPHPIIRLGDGAAIPPDPNNADFQQYLAWCAKGNTPLPPPSLSAVDLRANAYPPLHEQLDMLWHDIDGGTLDKKSEFYKTLKAVKDRFPK